METYKVTYTWTKEELLKSLRHHYRSKLHPGIVMAISIMAILMSGLSIFILVVDRFATSVSVTSIIPLLFAIYWLFLRRRVNEWWLTYGFDKNPAANKVIQWEFSEERLKQECADVVSFQAEWKMLSRVVETVDGFLFYTYPRHMFYWLPLAGFQKPEAIEELRTIVQGKEEIPYTKITA